MVSMNPQYRRNLIEQKSDHFNLLCPRWNKIKPSQVLCGTKQLILFSFKICATAADWQNHFDTTLIHFIRCSIQCLHRSRDQTVVDCHHSTHKFRLNLFIFWSIYHKFLDSVSRWDFPRFSSFQNFHLQQIHLFCTSKWVEVISCLRR